MNMEKIGNIESESNLDPRIEEILAFYDPSIREEALEEWKRYSEEERNRFYSEFMRDHKTEAV